MTNPMQSETAVRGHIEYQLQLLGIKNCPKIIIEKLRSHTEAIYSLWSEMEIKNLIPVIPFHDDTGLAFVSEMARIGQGADTFVIKGTDMEFSMFNATTMCKSAFSQPYWLVNVDLATIESNHLEKFFRRMKDGCLATSLEEVMSFAATTKLPADTIAIINTSYQDNESAKRDRLFVQHNVENKLALFVHKTYWPKVINVITCQRRVGYV